MKVPLLRCALHEHPEPGCTVCDLAFMAGRPASTQVQIERMARRPRPVRGPVDDRVTLHGGLGEVEGRSDRVSRLDGVRDAQWIAAAEESLGDIPDLLEEVRRLRSVAQAEIEASAVLSAEVTVLRSLREEALSLHRPLRHAWFEHAPGSRPVFHEDNICAAESSEDAQVPWPCATAKALGAV